MTQDHSQSQAAAASETAAAGAPSGSETTSMSELQKELQASRDQALRVQAELENFRKRAQRDLEEERRYAQLPLIRDLLPVLDNVERAIEAAEKGGDATGLLTGFKMVAQQLTDTLTRHQCQRIEALHQPFDPALHEAIAQQPSDAFPAHTVLAVAQAGYRLHDRVVRPSQVIVSTANSAVGTGKQ